MDNLKPKQRPMLRLVREDETASSEANTAAEPKAKPKSAFASQMTSFADDLDAQIALLLNS